MKPDNLQNVKGKWWRFSGYDLLDGTILPAKGSILIEYDPWPQYLDNRGKRRTVSQPYVPLLELCRQLERLEEQGVRPSRGCGFHPRHEVPILRGPRTKADELLLSWCNDHGLLGIVSTIYARICTPTKVHEFAQGCWRTFTPASRPAKPVIKQLWWHGAGTPLESDDIQALHPFFPDSYYKLEPTEMLEFPTPNTPEFWTVYGEPSVDFVRESCLNFARAANTLSKRVRIVGRPTDEEAVFQQSLTYMGVLSRFAGDYFTCDENGNVVKEWWSPSLLSSYARMLMEDLASQRRVISCEKCGSLFVSDEPRAKFCTTRCRASFQSARHYESKKIKSEE